MFKLLQTGNIKYYVPDTIARTGLVRVGFSTREGGVSSGCYSSMNLRWNCDDSRENVLENFKLITDAIGIDYRDVVHSKQVHEDVVMAVDESDKGNGIIRENVYESADALVTDKAGVALATSFADCTPVFFLDPVKKVIALAHSGWRGTVKRISAKTVEKMMSDYGSNPADIIAAIGPSIQLECFEVGDDVAEIFISEFGKETVEKINGRFHVSMQTAIRKQLNEIGVKNIDDCGICTYCNSDLLFSHRKTNGRRGNMCAFMQLV